MKTEKTKQKNEKEIRFWKCTLDHDAIFYSKTSLITFQKFIKPVWTPGSILDRKILTWMFLFQNRNFEANYFEINLTPTTPFKLTD